MTIKKSSTNKYEKQLKLMRKRGKDLGKLAKLLDLIDEGISQGLRHHALLPDKYRLHKLSGNFNNRWECHIEPDWLLIYYLDDEQLILERTGTHTDLFK